MKQLTSLFFFVFVTTIGYAQVKIGSNPTTITANKNLEVEATNGKMVSANKDNGIVYIENKPNAVATDSVVMRASNGEVRQMSVARLASLMAANSACDPDTDGDGIPNSTDTDDDGDGVLDTVDNCKLVYGTAANNGCPTFASSSTNGYVAPAVTNGTLDLSGMPIGQCFYNWPYGIYNVKVTLYANYRINAIEDNGSSSIPIDGVYNALSGIWLTPRLFSGFSDGNARVGIGMGDKWGALWHAICRVQ